LGGRLFVCGIQPRRDREENGAAEQIVAARTRALGVVPDAVPVLREAPRVARGRQWRFVHQLRDVEVDVHPVLGQTHSGAQAGCLHPLDHSPGFRLVFEQQDEKGARVPRLVVQAAEAEFRRAFEHGLDPALGGAHVLDDRRQLPELDGADRASEFGHATATAPGDGAGFARCAIDPGDAEVVGGHTAFVKLLIVGDQQSALARRGVFVPLQTEHAQRAESPEPPAAKSSSVGLGAILQHRNAAPVCDRHNGLHVAGCAGHVNRHNQFGSRGDLALQVLRVHAEAVVHLA